MGTSKRIKDTAALVGAVAGIVTGIEKVRQVLIKWRQESKSTAERPLKEDPDALHKH